MATKPSDISAHRQRLRDWLETEKEWEPLHDAMREYLELWGGWDDRTIDLLSGWEDYASERGLKRPTPNV